LKPAHHLEGKIIFAPLDVLFSVLSEKSAPQEVPSHTPWGCEHPQLRIADIGIHKIKLPSSIKFCNSGSCYIFNIAKNKLVFLIRKPKARGRIDGNVA